MLATVRLALVYNSIQYHITYNHITLAYLVGDVLILAWPVESITDFLDGFVSAHVSTSWRSVAFEKQFFSIALGPHSYNPFGGPTGRFLKIVQVQSVHNEAFCIFPKRVFCTFGVHFGIFG
jgi:hypothetical protein